MATLIASRMTGSIPGLLSCLADFVGPSDLNKRLQRVRKKLGSRSVTSGAALDRYAIPLGLVEMYGRKLSAPRNISLTQQPHLYGAVSFAAGIVEFSRHMSPAARKILRGRTLAALDPANDARPLAHELRVAFSLAHQGWDIELTDFESNGRYDFTVRLADKEVEVECKSVTGDCGNAIHREEFDLLGEVILKRLKRQTLSDLVVRVDVAIADRLPNAPTEIQELVNSIAHAISGGGVISGIHATVRISQIGVSPIDPNDLPESGRRALDKIREERNGSVFGFFDKKQFIAIHVYSERESRVQDSIRSTIEAASPQFTKNRPGIIWTHFPDLNDRELNSLIEIDRNGSVTLLRGIAYKMFNSVKHEHIAALFFSGEAPVRKFGGPESLIIHNPFYSQRGTIYPLWNRACRLNRPFRELM